MTKRQRAEAIINKVLPWTHVPLREGLTYAAARVFMFPGLLSPEDTTFLRTLCQEEDRHGWEYGILAKKWEREDA